MLYFCIAGLWRHPEDRSAEFNEVEHWVDLAKLLEKSKFHGIFIADVLGMLRTFDTIDLTSLTIK